MLQRMRLWFSALELALRFTARRPNSKQLAFIAVLLMYDKLAIVIKPTWTTYTT